MKSWLIDYWKLIKLFIFLGIMIFLQPIAEITLWISGRRLELFWSIICLGLEKVIKPKKYY